MTCLKFWRPDVSHVQVLKKYMPKRFGCFPPKQKLTLFIIAVAWSVYHGWAFFYCCFFPICLFNDVLRYVLCFDVWKKCTIHHHLRRHKPFPVLQDQLHGLLHIATHGTESHARGLLEINSLRCRAQSTNGCVKWHLADQLLRNCWELLKTVENSYSSW